MCQLLAFFSRAGVLPRSLNVMRSIELCVRLKPVVITGFSIPQSIGIEKT